MFEMLNVAPFETLRRFFIPLSRMVCENDKYSLKWLMSLWTDELSVEEKRFYSRAFLNVFRSLPSEQRKRVELTFKASREKTYLLTPRSKNFIHMVTRRSNRVHIPIWCKKCRKEFVVKKRVEETLEDEATGKLDTCPYCGTPGITPEPVW